MSKRLRTKPQLTSADPEELFALAELIADAVAAKPPGLNAPPNLEPVIRANLAAARSTEDARNRALKHLQRRVNRHLKLLRVYMDDDSLWEVLGT